MGPAPLHGQHRVARSMAHRHNHRRRRGRAAHRTLSRVRMLLRIARHEWQIMVGENTPPIVLVLLAVAIGYAISNGIHWLDFEQATLQRARDEEAQRYDGLKQQLIDIESGRQKASFNDPRVPAVAGRTLAWRYAAMPPMPLSALSIGQSDLVPYYFKVSTASKESVLTTSEIE